MSASGPEIRATMLLVTSRARDVPLIQVAARSPVGLDGSGTAVKSCPEWGRGSHRLPPIMMTLRLAALSSCAELR